MFILLAPVASAVELAWFVGGSIGRLDDSFRIAKGEGDRALTYALHGGGSWYFGNNIYLDKEIGFIRMGSNGEESYQDAYLSGKPGFWFDLMQVNTEVGINTAYGDGKTHMGFLWGLGMDYLIQNYTIGVGYRQHSFSDDEIAYKIHNPYIKITYNFQ